MAALNVAIVSSAITPIDLVEHRLEVAFISCPRVSGNICESIRMVFACACLYRPQTTAGRRPLRGPVGITGRIRDTRTSGRIDRIAITRKTRIYWLTRISDLTRKLFPKYPEFQIEGWGHPVNHGNCGQSQRQKAQRNWQKKLTWPKLPCSRQPPWAVSRRQLLIFMGNLALLAVTLPWRPSVGGSWKTQAEHVTRRTDRT
jgi:hypothetical protein